METALDRYIREHSTAQEEALEWIEKQTNIRTNYPRMLSGAVQGRLLKMLVQMSGARAILEIGAFTGYSSTCMAFGTQGHIDTLEINDELEDLMREAWDHAGVTEKVTLHIGDARETLARFSSEDRRFDFVYMDANKRQYLEYYELVLPMLESGAVILADDTLWDGKVYAEKVAGDKQTQGLVAFNDFVATDPRVEVVMLPIRDGLTIIRKK